MRGRPSQPAGLPPPLPLLGVAAVSALIALAYASSFGGAFQFDDLPAIVENPTIRHLATSFRPPVGALTVSGRPLLNLSFALNYAVSAERVWSYHLLNLAIHVAAALLLLGIVRRTLAAAGNVWANGIALTAALIWAVHPLTTESVTYIVQRAESLSGMFFLGAFYCFVRMVGGEDSHRRRWAFLSWGSCLLAIMVKEVAVTAPVVILLYDRTFVAASWRDLWKKRSGYYAAMASTWVVLLILVGANGWDRGGTSGLGVGVAWLPYWISQGEAVARYCLLSVWPYPLAFDYGLASAPFGLALGLFAALVVGIGFTVIGALRGRPWAFFAGSALVILSPTSVMPGVLQFASEHRTYLPLCAVVVGVVTWIAGRLEDIKDLRTQRWAIVALVVIPAIGFGSATFARNQIYADDLALWSQTVERRPASPTAQANLGQALLNRGRLKEAVPHCELAVELNPLLPTARYNLGLAYENLERWQDALGQFERACSLNPKLFYAQYHAGRLLDRFNQPAEAEKHLLAALREEPNFEDVHASLGVAEAALGKSDEAVREYNLALKADPKQPEVEYNLAQVLAYQGHLREASSHFDAAVALKSDYWEAELNDGIALAQMEQMIAAERSLKGAVRDRPASAEAHANLGIVIDQEGRHAEAVTEYQTALRLKPDYAEAHYNLGNALLAERKLRAARIEFAEAVRLRPDFSAARDMVTRIDSVLGSAP